VVLVPGILIGEGEHVVRAFCRGQMVSTGPGATAGKVNRL